MRTSGSEGVRGPRETRHDGQASRPRSTYSVAAAKEALHEYLENQYVAVQRPALDLQGSNFQMLVWRSLLDIPAGRTRSYSDIANIIGRPDVVRAVVHAVGANPIALMIPCHRVVGKDGRLKGYHGGLALQETLLHMEGFY